jgi:hypothetical protein
MRRTPVGTDVNVTVTGVVTGYDADLGVYTVRGTVPGMTHIEWEWEFHWATEFTSPCTAQARPQERQEQWGPFTGVVAKWFRLRAQWREQREQEEAERQRCPAGGVHDWRYYAGDGAGLPFGEGYECTKCGEGT